MAQQTLTSSATLTLFFDQIAPPDTWVFCVVDIDVENCLFTAIDENDNEVPLEVIDGWLLELFDADLDSDGLNVPKWDPSHAALLGTDTPEDYVVYNDLVIGGLSDSEAAAAFFMPNIPLKTLIIDYENLQDFYFVSCHFYMASMHSTGIEKNDAIQLSIYPNPVSSVVSLKSSIFSKRMADVEIVDLFGQIVLKEEKGSRGEGGVKY